LSALPTAGVTFLGVLLIAVASRDVFDALFHPEGKAALARALMRCVWLVFRRLGRSRPGVFALAGPVALLAVIAAWALLLVLGWALVFWPHVHADFQIGAVRGGSFAEAVHTSLVTLTTLGFTDVLPRAEWLRIVAPIEALVGVALLSASISWLLLLYPALSRRRSLAYEIWLLAESERRIGSPVERSDPNAAQRLYAELTSRLIAVERDLVSFPVSYYFAERDPRFALAAAAPSLLDLAERGLRADLPDAVRVRALMLREALGDFAATTAERFHGRAGETVEETLAAYARDHLHAQDRVDRVITEGV
jgi:hypothetical protein